MPDARLQDLTAAGTVDGTELLYTLQASSDRKATAEQIREYARKQTFYPIYNVLSYGADPTGATDSSSAFQAAIDACELTKGTVFIPQGYYTIGTCLTITQLGVTVRGANQFATIIRGTTSTASIFNITASACELADMTIGGPAATIMTGGTLITAYASGGSYWHNLWIIDGYNGMVSYGNGTNNLFELCIFDGMYGSFMLKVGPNAGGHMIHNCQFDQCAPASATLAGYKGAFAAGTYATGDTVHSGGYFYVCESGGSASAMTPTRFYTSFTTGTSTWRMIAKTDFCPLWFYSSPQNYLYMNDITSYCYANVLIDTGCDGTQVISNQGGLAFRSFVELVGNNTNTFIRGNYFSASMCYGIYDNDGAIDRITISDNHINYTAGPAIAFIADSAIININNNVIYRAGEADNYSTEADSHSIYMLSGVTHFNISNNIVRVGATQTSSAAGIRIESGCNNYSVVGNTFVSLPTRVSDSGGTPKLVSNY